MAKPNITLLNATYSGVTGVTLPKQGGGTATFPWVEGSETKTQNGTYDVTSLAQIVINVAGGGGSGLVYETGTYKPTSDIARPTIDFTNTHSDRPFCVLMQDITESTGTSNSGLFFGILSWYDFTGVGYNSTSATVYHYARVEYSYKSSSGVSNSGSNISALTGTSSSTMPYYLTNSSFRPYTGSTSRYWRANRTYKWIAVWKPTT